ncbi:MAG TPA: DinB family protein [Bryobacteraceae bacterium]|nr:DinB family protein [Bryobacteraceae bacterium]
MALRDALLPEFDQEMVTARKHLERVPEDKFDWRPHVKSGTMGWLAGHIAEIPEWAVEGIKKDSVDLAPGGVHVAPPAVPADRAALLEMFDTNVAAARAAIAEAEDGHLQQNWSLLMNGKTILTMPRTGVLRSFVMNHLVHHRAQLGVYLRLNDVPVPSTYGPSADESGM